MNDLELRLTDLLARKADEVDVRPVDGFAETPYTTALASTDLDSMAKTHAIWQRSTSHLRACDLGWTGAAADRPGHPRRRRRRGGRGRVAG